MPKTTKKAAPAKKAVKPKAVKKAAPKKTVKKAAPKKTAKKAVKKTTTKKSPAKRSAKRELVYAPDHASFWTTDGKVLNSLIALRDALDAMEKEVYLYHAGKEHNDFANWVDSVLCDEECAKALEKAKTPKSAKTIVVRHLKVYAV